ncbi:hypothetical protein NEIFLAOT_01294 [Neisseria flavescens NRL30031/H210]|uniref:Uncharacterized protein n=1 Tax=Neisseria flavescens NRL30031/H210 TaxID=546264 RepID=C0EMW7_NEIFL|nr:hypothetical protein NEIFLAOT_01294 [Neisseria flavescens NRL30031/H210]
MKVRLSNGLFFSCRKFVRVIMRWILTASPKTGFQTTFSLSDRDFQVLI